MVEECIKGIVRIPVPLPGSPLKYTNSYLIQGKRNLLIDTGFCRPECKTAILSALAQLGASLEQTDFFITHHHSDHVGLAPELVKPDGRIYIGKVELQWLHKYQVDGWEQFDRRFAKEGFPLTELEQLWKQNPARIYAPPISHQYVPVEDGKELQYGGYTLVCKSMPGHTPGHMCLYLPEHQLMFLGDHVLFDITPNIIAWPGVKNALGDYKNSLQALQGYDVAIPLPGHREVGKKLSVRIQDLLRHHDIRLQEAKEILEGSPGLTAYELAGRMRWNIRSKSWETFPLAQKWFAVGETMAHVDELLAREELRVWEDTMGIRHYKII